MMLESHDWVLDQLRSYGDFLLGAPTYPDVPIERDSIGAMDTVVRDQSSVSVYPFKPYVYRGLGYDIYEAADLTPKPRKYKAPPRLKPKHRPEPSFQKPRQRFRWRQVKPTGLNVTASAGAMTISLDGLAERRAERADRAARMATRVQTGADYDHLLG